MLFSGRFIQCDKISKSSNSDYTNGAWQAKFGNKKDDKKGMVQQELYQANSYMAGIKRR